MAARCSSTPLGSLVSSGRGCRRHPRAAHRHRHRLRPLVPPIEGIETVPYLTDENLFDLPEQPGHLIIIGGGVIGMEVAELPPPRQRGDGDAGEPMGRDDPESVVVVDVMTSEGVRFVNGSAAKMEGGEGVTIRRQLRDDQRHPSAGRRRSHGARFRLRCRGDRHRKGKNGKTGGRAALRSRASTPSGIAAKGRG